MHRRETAAMTIRRLAMVGIPLILLCAGCGTTARLVQATGDGGVVTYGFTTLRTHLASDDRREALKLIDRYCRGPYTIIQEGEAKSWSGQVEGMAGQDVVTQRRWGIRFKCKDGSAKGSNVP